ncbi:MAG: hypothetical protein K0S10_2967 [Rubrobacteraceae bacterium]|jgi:hypothetical protein|nr:hypothetical protein [Rubrobacteraceae bacterium]
MSRTPMNARYARAGRLEEDEAGEITAAYEGASERLVALAHPCGKAIGGPREAA